MKRHKKLRSRELEEIFDNPKSKTFVVVNDFLAFVTLISIAALVLETVAAFDAYTRFFRLIEYTAVIIFTLEYAGRFIASRKKISYIFSFFGIIDLLSILPTYLGLANLTFLKAARALRILRFLRMIRLAKLVRIPKRKKDGAAALYGLNLQIYGIALFCALLVLGTLFYIFESESGLAKDIPSGMYLAFMAILGGIPYTRPETLGGTVTLIAARFVSMILLGMTLSLIGTMMRKVLIGSEKDA